MTITEAIVSRRSVRDYDNRPLTAGELHLVTDAVNSARAPWPGQWTATMVSSDGGECRPSTYGMIRGARDYITVGIADDRLSRMSAGYCMEQVVITAWLHGLGTCWLGGTFRSATFTPPDGGLPLQAVIPVGHPGRSGFINRIARTIVGSDRRKPMSEMFFEADARTPLTQQSRYYRALGLMRAAPSSTNCQPWRAIVGDTGTVHFYSHNSRPMCDIDMGIGIRHFVYGCPGGTPRFECVGNHPTLAGCEYIITAHCD